MATKKIGSNVTAKLTVPPEVKPLIKDIENKKLLGGTSIDFYLRTAEEDGASGDDVRIKLGADKIRHLATLVQSAASRKAAEGNDWLSEKQFELAQRTAENDDQPAPETAETSEYDEKAAEYARQADALGAFHATLWRAAEAMSPATVPFGFRAQGEGHVISDPGVDVEEAEETADINTAEKLLGKATRIVERLDKLDRKKSPEIQTIDPAALASAQATVASALEHRGSPANPMRVQMKRAEIPNTPDTALWLKIRRSSIDLGWDKYEQFITGLLQPGSEPAAKSRLRLPFPDVDPYRFLKAATEVFMMVNCETLPATAKNPAPHAFDRVWTAAERKNEPGIGFSEADEDLAYAERRLGRSFSADQIEKAWKAYLVQPDPEDPTDPSLRVLPYLALIRTKLGDQGLSGPTSADDSKAILACSGILRNKLASPCLIELIWSYWHEESMLVQTMNAISRRFQNIRIPGDCDPLGGVEIDPLRPLNNVLWGYIQDEQHRLTVVRRAYEYDHQYGLSLVGKAVPAVKGADTRTRFLEAFHNLLHLCTIFFKEDDDTTVIADGFPILNALRDVHLVLTQGAHNQYGDLPWTARQEMLMQEWILARPEMREFIPTRIMVAYPEAWQDRVDAMKNLMGWTDTSVLHFSELGTYGERILLGARFNDWSTVIEPERAANWARFWRPEIQSYVHAYRVATGIDLTERAQAAMPSTLLRQRLAMQRVAAR